ncbi:unnamed protein product, partial [Gongylonema pulchrum]|uniref:SAG family member n=1 Tax=Gongylonema pulchrum TaxID=637853 RepID=A0A183EKB7_9BILA
MRGSSSLAPQKNSDATASSLTVKEEILCALAAAAATLQDNLKIDSAEETDEAERTGIKNVAGTLYVTLELIFQKNIRFLTWPKTSRCLIYHVSEKGNGFLEAWWTDDRNSAQ